MNRNALILSALSLALAVPTFAQTAAPASAPSAAAAPAPIPPPQAIPAKIALISFDQAVMATNEGRKAIETLQAKYAPQQQKLTALGQEVESLQKQVGALPANAPDEERASKLKALDTKQKQYQRDLEDASQAYNGEVQEALGRIAQKFAPVASKVAQDLGFTIMLNASGESSPIVWVAQGVNVDISQAAVDAYNTSSGVAAPTPSAPAAPRPKAPAAAPKAAPHE